MCIGQQKTSGDAAVESKNDKACQGSCGRSMLTKTTGLAVAAVGLAVVLFLPNLDLMKGLSNDVAMSPVFVQAAVTAFCLTPGTLDQFTEEGRKGDSHYDPTQEGVVVEDFHETGEVREDEYEKASLYAFLYGMYQSVGEVRHTNGELYEFSFNTWGIHNPDDKPYGPEEPQRHGKAAYNKLTSSFTALRKFMTAAADDTVSFLEIGCGTGAGANLVSGEVWPDKIKVYNALDMQAGGIKKCKTWVTKGGLGGKGNPKLNCVHGNGKQLPFADNSQDVVVISETHIAEMAIGPEEKAIFAEMVRVLKPGGFFVWGNALPTKVWFDGRDYLTKEMGFTLTQEFNHTASAVIARDEDFDRVRLYLDQVYTRFPVFSWVPHYGEKCRKVTDMLLRNFFRDVGTDLYKRMVDGEDSYMHQCYQLQG